MHGFDILGATLADQYITLRVRGVDRNRLKAKLGDKGALASAALTAVDASAKAALDAALPIVVGKARDYGIDLEVTVSDVPPKMHSRAISEFWFGLAGGLLVGGTGFGIVKLVGKLFKK